MMHKHIMPTVSFDKSKTLAVIKPFYSTFYHFLIPYIEFDFFHCFSWCGTQVTPKPHRFLEERSISFITQNNVLN